jgi:CelD/BcsL family acetyltransferase involved in cellulose biosynthesis
MSRHSSAAEHTLETGALPPLVVSEVDDLAALRAMAPEWDLLLDDADGDGIFRSPGWLLPWAATLAPSVRPRVLAVRAAGHGELWGLLPLCEEVNGRPRHWRLMGSTVVGSDHLGLVARRGGEVACARAVAAALEQAAASGRLDVLELEDLDPEAAANVALLDELARGPAGQAPRRLISHRASECPFVPGSELRPFPGLHVERSDPSMAAQLRRKRAWLERRPGYQVRRCEGAETAAALEEWLRLHHWRWQLEGGSGALISPEVDRFHRAAATELGPLGRLSIYLMEAEGTVVAAVYTVQRGTKACFYQSGYDPAWNKRSVGAVLLSLVLEDCGARGMVELDLLRGAESYKFRLASGRRETRTVQVPMTRVGRIWLEGGARLRAARAWLKARLPDGVRETLKSGLARVRRLRGREGGT